jgi:hypothetical protein
VLVAAVLALTSLPAGAAPEFTPGRPAPPPCVRVGGCAPPVTLTINPTSGPVGTSVAYRGVCGTTPTQHQAIAVTFGTDALDPANVLGGGYLVFRNPDPGTTVGAFHGAITVPSTLPTGAVTPGLYYISGGCCLATSPCTPGGPSVHPLTVTTFCVSDRENPCNWFYWVGGPLGAWNYFGQRFILQVANQFTAPVSQASPPPGETTTTRPRATTSTNPPQTSQTSQTSPPPPLPPPPPPPPPPPTTTTTTCVGKPPKCF